MVRLLTVALAAAAFAAGSALAAPLSLPKYPAAKMQVRGFGAVLASSNRQALYYWSKEKPGAIKCTGSCAEAWPPLYVPKGVTVKAKQPGLSGRFGVVRRPDGRRQLTRNGRAVYSYAHEGAGVVLCDDVDGWFVVRL